MLEAVAPAALIDQLAMQSPGFERDGYAAVRVEVLERDRDDVRAVDLRQSGPATDADALRVCIEVERVSV